MTVTAAISSIKQTKSITRSVPMSMSLYLSHLMCRVSISSWEERRFQPRLWIVRLPASETSIREPFRERLAGGDYLHQCNAIVFLILLFYSRLNTIGEFHSNRASKPNFFSSFRFFFSSPADEGNLLNDVQSSHSNLSRMS